MTWSASSSPSVSSSSADGKGSLWLMRARTPVRAMLAAGGLLAAVSLLIVVSDAGLAQEAPPRIAYVDMTRVINESTLFVAGRARLTEEFTVRNRAFQLEEARLRELESRRDREVTGLSSVDAEDLKREIATLENSIARQRKDLNQALNRRMKEMTEGIDRRIREEIGAYARAEGFDLVLTDGIGFANPRLDITDVVLERVNLRADEIRTR